MALSRSDFPLVQRIASDGTHSSNPLAFQLARRLLVEGTFALFLAECSSSCDTGFGQDVEQRCIGLRDLNERVPTRLGGPKPRFGQPECREILLGIYPRN